jgi:hypothetical protein
MQQEQSPAEIERPEEGGPFAPSIMKLAQANGLGQPQQEYLVSFPLDPHGRATRLTIAAWLCALLIVFLLYLPIGTRIATTPLITLLIWIAAAALFTLLVWVGTILLQYRRKKTHYQRIYACTSGLLCQILDSLDSIEAIHWHRIDIVKYDTQGNCQVHRNDGRVFFFSPPPQRLGELSSCIEQAIIPHHLPQLLTTYRDGLPLIFGPLRINQQGIGLEEKNVILFTWNRIKDIERRFDSLVLKLDDGRSLRLPLAAHEIPNVNLALAVIRKLLAEAEQITQKLPDADEAGVQKGQETKSGASPDLMSDGILTTMMGDPIGTGTSDRLSVVVYERGFLYLNKVNKKLDIVRWDQITQVIRRTHNSSRLVEYSVEVTRDDETTFVFPHTQPLIAGIGLYVEQKAAEWALPALLKQYDANETTAFGKLTVNQTGISYNKRTLPWSEVYEMRIFQPNSVYLVIRQRGYSQAWQLIAINKIADVYLLKLLIDYILSTHPAVQR